MLRFAAFLFTLFFTFSLFAQKDVTKFLGFPVDGSKSEMIKNLKSKGFKVKTLGDIEYLTGRFNGEEVKVHILVENGKVARIMLADVIGRSERDIKQRFNRLCNEFNKNGKYVSNGDFIITDDEDISYEMLLHDKRYEASFYQLPEGMTLEEFVESVANDALAEYPIENRSSLPDELIIIECMTSVYEHLSKKSVWFDIVQDSPKEYRIFMYYDNEYNRANGEDL